MIRLFKFETAIDETVSLVPIAVRRKLDRVGIKIGLDQWRALGLGERLAICHLPTQRQDECDALSLFIREAVKRTSGAEPKIIDESERMTAEPPATPPPQLVERARTEGFTLDASAWSDLDSDQRYALMKLGGGKKLSHDFPAALREFLKR
ncbi:MAG: nitrate reductase associated protein [Candidatus Binataceae bacterium]